MDSASTGTTTRPDGPSVSEFIVAGSYTEPEFRIIEGSGRFGNNKAASSFIGSPCDTTANQPPVITSAPPITATVGAACSYQVQATDPNNDSLTYLLTTAPSGMTMSATGLINWTPDNTQTGPSTVTVRVSDSRGGTAEQLFTINVATPPGANSPPRITSTPVLSVVVGQAYQYGVTAVDPDGDTVLFALLQFPSGAAIDPFTGVVSWTLSTSQVGPRFFTIEAQDGRGGRTTQSFAVQVQPSLTSLPDPPLDQDGDGFDETEDCADTNPLVHPGRPEIPGNGIDDDCNEITPDDLPPGALSCSLFTNKRSYDANSLAQLTSSIRNLGPTLTISGMQAQLTVRNADGQAVHIASIPVNALSPKGLSRATEPFNTAIHPPGTYQAALDVQFGAGSACSAQASFAINSSGARGRALTGNITADPASVAVGDVNFEYQVSNVGNVDLPSLELSVLIVELSNGLVARTITEQTALNKGQVFSGSRSLNVSGLNVGDYLAILQGESGGITQTVSSAPFTVVSSIAIVADAGSFLVNESCPQANGAINPDERVTVHLKLKNLGSSSTSNLVASLQSTGGVVLPSGPQSYEAIAPGGTFGRDFSFTAAGSCGGTITTTLQLQDGANNLGAVTFSFPIGVQTASGYVCTPQCGLVRLMTTSTLTRTGPSTVRADITLTNTGSTLASNVTINNVLLGSNGGSPLPLSVGNIAPGMSANVTVEISNTNPGTSQLHVKGTHNGGTFGSSRRVTIP